MPSTNARGGVKTPPYGLTHQRGAHTPPQPRAATRQRTATHVGGGVPDAPEASCRRKHNGRDKSLPYNQPFTRRFPSPPISGKTTGPGMPGPYRAAAGKPHAVRKRPRRGQDPSLRTDPSTSARPPGRHICRPYSACMNYIRRAGCPHPAASSRGHPSTGSHPRRGRRPRRPGNLPPPQTYREG